MEKLLKILSVGGLSVFFLAACTNPFTKEEVSKKTVKTEVVVSETAEVTESVTEPVDMNEPADEVVLTSRYGSNMKCTQLTSLERRQECEMQVNDVIGSMLESEIIATFDVGRCRQLPEGVAEDCEQRLAETGVQGPVSDAERVIYDEAIRPSYPAMEEGDADVVPQPVYTKEKCAELSTPGYRAYCERVIDERIDRSKLDEILTSEDVNRCSELSNVALQEECQMFFGVELEEDELEV